MLTGSPALAQELRPKVAMPWTFIGLDPHFRSEHQVAIDQVVTNWQQTLIPDGQFLTEKLDQNVFSLNHLRKARNVWLANDGSSETDIVVEPILCQMRGFYAVMVQIYGAENGELLSSSHQILDSQSLMLADNNRQLNTSLQRASQLAFNKLKSDQPPRDALHLGIRLQHNVSRQNEADHRCLNLLIEEQLLTSYTITRSLGNEGFDHLRRSRATDAPYRRTTRNLVIAWRKIAAQNPTESLWTIDVTIYESVFGRSITKLRDLYLRISRDENQLVANLPDTMMKFLADEKEALSLKDLPMSTRIYGAWVYLDKGRAYGLKMNDRMVAEINGEQIKGHVVKFYGPELNLRSPRGYSVNEGAILYIRKNQGLVRPGIEFRFDPQTYPAPWPPSP